MTRRVHAERAIETLWAGKAKSIGAVLNRVDFDRNKYYYSRYYGYHYQNYYGSGQQQEDSLRWGPITRAGCDWSRLSHCSSGLSSRSAGDRSRPPERLASPA